MAVRDFGHSKEGVSAVEFALVAPMLVMFLLGIICFSMLFSIANGLQQLAAEAARASVAGLSDTERGQLAQSFVSANVAAYPFLRSQQLTVATAAIAVPSPAFQVSLTYDVTSQISSLFGTLLPSTVTRLQRSAIVLTSTSQ